MAKVFLYYGDRGNHTVFKCTFLYNSQDCHVELITFISTNANLGYFLGMQERMHTFYTCHTDYCNAILYGVSAMVTHWRHAVACMIADVNTSQ